MTKERMIADSSEKGIIRYKIIRDALGRYGDACEKGYYLEAITINLVRFEKQRYKINSLLL